MITSQKIADLMNEALALDPGAAYFLMCAIAPANQGLLDHPTIVCRPEPNSDRWVVSPLGFLQGVAALEGNTIAAVYEDRKLVGFKVIQPTTFPEGGHHAEVES